MENNKKKYTLVCNGHILGNDDDTEKLMDVLFEKYPKIEVWGNFPFHDLYCNFDDITRKNVWDWTDTHEGITSLGWDLKYNNESLYIEIYDSFYVDQYNDETDENLVAVKKFLNEVDL